MAKATKVNPHTGSSFDDFLKEDGIYEEVQARALKRALAEQLNDAMQNGKLSKVNMAQRMATSRSQLDRLLDPSNLSIQLDTLVKAASAVAIANHFGVGETESPLCASSKKPEPRRQVGTAAVRHSLIAALCSEEGDEADGELAEGCYLGAH
eukprot:gene25429-31890_t